MIDILVNDFILIIMIFLRIIAAMSAAPFFGHKAVIPLVKVSISFLIAYIIFLVSNNNQASAEISLSWVVGNSLAEISTGLLIGFTLNFVFYGFSFAGSLIGFDMGLSMSQVFNPGDDTESNIIGEVLHLSGVLIFLLIDGHHYLIRSLLYSFTVIPIGKSVFSASLQQLLIKYSSGVFVVAVKIAAPVMISFFLIHIAEGILTRIIPQMQIFFVSQPLKLGIGFLILFTLSPVMFFLIKNLLKQFEDNLFELVKVMGA